MPVLDHSKSRRSAAPLCAVAFSAAIVFLIGGVPALASDRWEEAAGGAVAILPVPVKAKIITGGSLACAEQKWAFRLRADLTGAPAIGTDGVVTVDGDAFAAKVEQEGSVLSIPVPYEAIDDLMTGTRLSFVIGEGKTAPAATFSLRYSKQVIEAITPRCSQIDMAGYDRINPIEFGPAVEQARPLMAEEAELFLGATKKEPTLSAATIQLPDNRSMLVTTLCGSTWYYGRSGCTLSAYVRSAPGSTWQEAYNSEGVALYLDRKSVSDGWPNLVTLPLVGGTEATHWTWTGQGYDLADRSIAEDAQQEGQGDVAQ